MRLPTKRSVNGVERRGSSVANRPWPPTSALCENVERAQAQPVPLLPRGLLVALLVLPMTARADDNVFSYGRGTHTTCGQFIGAMEAHKIMQQANGAPRVSSERSLIMEYVDGLLTGVNLSRDRAHQITSSDAAIELWLQKWCAKHSTNNLLDALGALSAETPGGALREGN